MPTTGSDHGKIWYETAGDTGSPVLLIMGYGMPGSAWQFQIPVLSGAHRVTWFDHRGVGRSPRLEKRAMSMPELAGDALGVMSHLGWKDAHVVGVSMGGMVAQHIAINAPRRVRSLTLIATHAGGLKSVLPPTTGLKLFLKANAARGGGRTKALSHLLYPPEYIEEEGDIVRQSLATDFAEPPPRRTRLAHLAAILRHNTRKQLPEVERPALVVRPGRDVLIRPEESDRLHELLPRARLIRFDDAGHGIIRQCRHGLNRSLLELFQRVDTEIDPDARPRAVH